MWGGAAEREEGEQEEKGYYNQRGGGEAGKKGLKEFIVKGEHGGRLGGW